GLKKYIEQIVNEPFDLSKDYMIRGHLIVLNNKEHMLVITMHHIASDGWSLHVFVSEVVKLYTSFIQGDAMPLAPLPIQYVDYAIWQRKYLEGEVLDKKLAYWKNKLQDVKVLRLPTDFARPEIQTARGALVSFNMGEELTAELHTLSQQHGATLFMALLTAFKVLLHRYSGQQDICVGTAIAGRQQHEMEGLIGFFVNTLAMRSEVNSETSFSDLLQQVKGTSIEAYENQEAPFEKVVDTIIGKRDLGTDPLVQVMFALQNTPEIKDFHLEGIELSHDKITANKALFELFFDMVERPHGLVCSIQYATDLYKEATILRMRDHFKTLLSSIVKEPQQKISELQMLTKEEEQQLLVDFNNTAVDYPKDKSVVDLFEEQVEKSPDATALVFEEEHLTYKQLNEKANQLAHYLVSKGVKEENLIPICIERSLEMITGILGILKAGGAYVPIDPEYPEERINYMLEDTSATVIITSKENKSKLKTTKAVELIEIDSDWSRLNGQLLTTNYQLSTTQPNHLAYIIYTSGSTGKPKGVMVEHRNVVSLVKEVDYVSISNKDILLSTGSPSFDATTFEYWAMLLNGGQLVLCQEKRLLDSELLKEEIEKRKVTKMWFTSSWFNQLVETDINIFAPLDTILVGGEKLSEHHIKKIREAYPSIKIVNGYGPTENTTFSLTYNITEIDENTSIPIGYPLTNRTAYILNEKHQLVPLNVTGEIFLGGAGLARGYLNRPELTAEKFIKNPFGDDAGSRLYRTGDLGRWLPDGNIEYLGRIDDQVKIRGYRIELGEIETVLNESGYINNSCVVVKKDIIEAKRLVSYYVPKLEIIKEKEHELYNRLIASWKELYETEYEKTEDKELSVDEEFNII
ncbi:MAG: amino acid adenylation domain-containing protein, partial [Chitinophagaceae bacterium]